MLVALLAQAGCGARTALWETPLGAAGSDLGRSGGAGSSAFAGGGSAANAGASAGDDGLGGASPAWIIRGDALLIDVFVSKVGVYVVTDQALLLYRRNAELVKTLPSKSRNLSAAFDGEYLSVASEDSLIVSYTLDLNSLFVTRTLFPCAALVLVSNHHAECGSENDVVRSAYDVLGGTEIAVSPFAYAGVPMQRVPGADAIVTFAKPSPDGDNSALSLFKVESDYLLTHLGTRRERYFSRAIGFGGLPATEIVTGNGVVLDPFDTSCGSRACFTPSGQLPIGENQRYLAFDTVDAKQTFALLEDDTRIPNGTGENDLKLYELRSLNVAARAYILVHYYRARIGSVVAMRRDELGESVLLGTRSAARTSGPGYYVLNLPTHY